MAFPAWLQDVSLSTLRPLNLRIQSQLDDSLFSMHDIKQKDLEYKKFIKMVSDFCKIHMHPYCCCQSLVYLAECLSSSF